MKCTDLKRRSGGVSERQHSLAEKVRLGDVFLHYIDGVHAWAGYSMVKSKLKANDHDSHPDWVAAHPKVILIERRVWLTETQCENTVRIPALSDKHYERQVAFTAVDPKEALLIIAAIKGTPDVPGGQPSPEFHATWIKGAKGYYKRIVKDRAKGKCRLCGEDGISWAAAKLVGIDVEERDRVRIADGFLDAAHIVSDCDLGSMTPDNLRALCPNCHRVIDRLPRKQRKQREELLRKI